MASPGMLGFDCTFKLGTGVSAVDLSGDGNDAKLSLARDTHEVSVFKSKWKEFIGGLSSGTLDFNGYYDKAVGKADDTLFAEFEKDTANAFELDPCGTGTGLPSYKGNCIITKYDVNTKVNAAIPFQSSFRITGAVTRTTQV